MKRTTITLTDDLADLLIHEARRQHTSVSALLRKLVKEAFGVSTRGRKIPFAGLFQDPGMVTGAQVDDELERRWANDIESDR